MTIETHADVVALQRIGRIVEPFLSTKSRSVHETADGWTLAGARGNLSAQDEHTMVITKGAPLVVTVH